MQSLAFDLPSLDDLPNQPLRGQRVGLIRETLAEGMDSGVVNAVRKACAHLEALGARVEEVG